MKKGRPKKTTKRKRYKKRDRIKVKQDYTSWASEHCWLPLLEMEYSKVFDSLCNAYPHYLDTAKRGLKFLHGDKNAVAYTLLENTYSYL